MRKVLIFSDYFFPGFRGGGPIQSVKNLCDNLQKNLNIIVFTRSHDLNESKNQYEDIQVDQNNLVNNFNVFYASSVSFKSLFNIIKREKPQVLYLNSFFSTLSIKVLIIRNTFFRDKQIILAPRGEFSPGALLIKKVKKFLYLKLFNLSRAHKNILFHSTDESEDLYIKDIFRDANSYQIANLSKIYKKKYVLPYKEINKLRLVFISRISPKKNLEFAIECLNNFASKSKASYKIKFDIFGTSEDLVYLKKCKSLVKNSSNIDINFHNEIYPDDIPDTLSQYHVFFLPTKGENFGHAIVESMQVGLLPLISNNTPWTNLEEINCGWSIHLDYKEIFISTIDRLVLMKNTEFMEYSNNVRKYIGHKINNENSIIKYLDLFTQE